MHHFTQRLLCGDVVAVLRRLGSDPQHKLDNLRLGAPVVPMTQYSSPSPRSAAGPGVFVAATLGWRSASLILQDNPLGMRDFLVGPMCAVFLKHVALVAQTGIHSMMQKEQGMTGAA